VPQFEPCLLAGDLQCDPEETYKELLKSSVKVRPGCCQGDYWVVQDVVREQGRRTPFDFSIPAPPREPRLLQEVVIGHSGRVENVEVQSAVEL
jgi:hypothetical protein